MANFLINSASSETVGTTGADLFDIEATLEGVSLFGVEGADTITAASNLAAAANARINAGKGADTITLSAVGLGDSEIFAGMGNDLLDIQLVNTTATTVRGGAGLDTIGVSAISHTATIFNGNDMSDRISAQLVSGSNATLIAAGAGADVVSATYSGGADMTLNGGLGHDVINISADGPMSAFIVAGGGGKDTINFADGSDALAGKFNVNGGDQFDYLVFSAAVDAAANTATIGGGAGADTLVFSATLDMSNGFVNAGEGKDSIYLAQSFGGNATALGDGTLNGGAGADTIDLQVGAVSGANGGTIFGGAQADKFELGNRAVTLLSGDQQVISGGSYLGYGAFDQSDLASTDLVSAGVTITHSGALTHTAVLFNLRTDTVDLTVGTAVTTQLSTTGGLGFVTFTATFNDTLTARVEALDAVAAEGNSFAFRDSTGTKDYIFVQGGAIGSGTDGDLLVEVETAVNQIAATNASALQVRSVG